MFLFGDVNMSNLGLLEPTDVSIYYRGRATGVAPILRTLTLCAWASLWLALYWILDPGNQSRLVHGVEFQPLSDLQATFEASEYHRPFAGIGRLLMLFFLSIAGIRILLCWVGWSATSYLITSDRVQFERGVLAKTIKSIDLWRIRDLIFRRGILEALFGLGSVVLVASDVTAQYSRIGPVRGARRLYDDLVEARNRAVRERGVTAIES